MRIRALLMLGLAVVLGLTSVFLLQRWVERHGSITTAQSPQAPAPTKTIVVAKTALAFGTTLTAQNLSEMQWPSGIVPVGSFAKVSDIVVPGQDRVALQAIEAGEPVLTKKVSGLGGRATLSTVIDENMRAMTIRVNDVLGVAGFVLPGDRVDILLTQREGRETPVTDILLQNVRVLGIDQDTNTTKDRPAVARAVTLEVTPEQTQQLTLAASVGTLSLALRNSTNVEAIASRTISVRDLRGEAPAPAPTAAAAPRVTQDPRSQIRVLRGTETSEVEVQKDGSVRTTRSARR